jgi:hypothetical protein
VGIYVTVRRDSEMHVELVRDSNSGGGVWVDLLESSVMASMQAQAVASCVDGSSSLPSTV